MVSNQIRGPVPVDEKVEVRRQYRRYRDALDAGYRHKASAIITENLLAWEPLIKARRIMTYLSFNAEVETFPLARRLLAENKSVAIPYIHQGAVNLIPAEITNLDHDLQLGPMGILEPRPDRLRPLDPKTVDVHVVPGVAFDEMGFRIGYGKGHYDHFLVLRSHHSVVVGAAFDVQVADCVPHEIWDIPMDYVMTETELIDCSVARAQMTGQLGLFQHPRFF